MNESTSNKDDKLKLVGHVYEFDSFRLVPAERQLLRDNQPVSLTPKAFDTLVILVQHSGHALKKDDLIRQVWPDSFVEESNLNHNISLIRKALNGGNGGDGYVETVRGHGFRFNAEVRAINPEQTAVLVHRRTRTHVVLREETSEVQKHTRIEQTTDRRLLRPRALVLGLFAGVGVLIAIWALFLKPSSDVGQPAGPPEVRSIAVLPFKFLGADGYDEYLGLGMADALITKFGRVKQISVRSTSSIQKYAKDVRDPVAIGRELKVDAVLDGRLQKADGRLRVTVQLLNMHDGVLLWTGKFDEDLKDLFTVQDSISEDVARWLMPELASEDKARLAKRYTENKEAFHAYLKGRYFWNKRTGDDNKKSLEYFRQAIELDPTFALAYAGLADAYIFSSHERKDKVAAVRAAAEKALAIDDTLAEAHTALANVSLFDDWDWPEAERRFQRAIELNPNYPTAHHWYAYYLAAIGRLDEALAEIKRAQELDPLSLIINTDVGQLLHFARRDDEAIEQLRKTIEMDPNFVMAHRRLAEVYDRKGMYEEALAEFQKACSIYDGKLRPLVIMGHAYALSGNRNEALRILAPYKQQSNERPSAAPKTAIALIYAGLGKEDQAFAWLEKAYAEREVELILLKVNPIFDSVRADPRFTDLLRRMKLSDMPA